MNSEWFATALSDLLDAQDPTGGWSYRPGGAPSVEPTVLASLALLSHAERIGSETDQSIRKAAEWLQSIQQTDGSLGVSASIPVPKWPTAHAMLLWAALEGFEPQRRKATVWLLQQKGLTYPREPGSVFGHDPSLAGWPWVAKTHSWLEPTVMAILALRREGQLNHARTQEGLQLIRDRAIAGGGWNYGNTAVYGSSLRPQPAPTGLALLGLSGIYARDEIVEQACAYLRRELSRLRSAQSLCWSVLGLSAWETLPENIGSRLEESFLSSRELADDSYQVSYLLLAADPRALILLGLRVYSE